MNSIQEPIMKTLASAFLLSSLAIGCFSRAVAADSKPDPSQYTLLVHVSAVEYVPGSGNSLEVLTVTVGGKHYQLQGGTILARKFDGLLNLGDYPARLSQDEHRTSYESQQEFELLFPDGTMRRFGVVAQSE
jgi:hypothetical protein